MLLRIARAQAVGALAAALVLAAALPAQAVYPIVNTPSAPRSVVAVPGDAMATAAWQTPATNGGSPITGYRVTSTPASAGCTVGPTALTCDISGLTNGTSYTFRVQAINAAGPGAPGTSNPVTPQAAVPVITISASRAGATVSVSGTTRGIPVGSLLTSWVRTQDAARFAEGSPATVQAGNSFAWSTNIPVRRSVEIYFTFRRATSNVEAVPSSESRRITISGSRSGEDVAIRGVAGDLAQGTSVTLFRVNPANGREVQDGSTRVGADGTFSFSTKAARDRRVAFLVTGGGARSNVLTLNPVSPALVLISISGTRDARPTVSASGQAFDLSIGTVAVPFVSLDGGPFLTGSGVRTLDAKGDFTWSRRIGSEVSRVTVYFATADGVTSNRLTLRR